MISGLGMKELLEAIELKSLQVQEGGAVVVKLSNNKTAQEQTQIVKMLEPAISKLQSKLLTPVIVVPSCINLDTITHDELKVLGII